MYKTFVILIQFLLMSTTFAEPKEPQWVINCKKSESPLKETYDALRETMGLLSKAECAQIYVRSGKVKTLILSNKNLTDLRPLRIFNQLTDLDISKNKIKDLSVIRDLNKLSFLKLDYNYIENFLPAKRVAYIVGMQQQLTQKNIEYLDHFEFEMFINEHTIQSQSVEYNLQENVDLYSFKKDKQNFLIKFALLFKIASLVSKLDPDKASGFQANLYEKNIKIIDDNISDLQRIYLLRTCIKSLSAVASFSGAIIINAATCGIATGPLIIGSLFSTGITTQTILVANEVELLHQLVSLSKNILSLYHNHQDYESKIHIQTLQRKLERLITRINSLKNSYQWTHMRKVSHQSSVCEDLRLFEKDFFNT